MWSTSPATTRIAGTAMFSGFVSAFAISARLRWARVSGGCATRVRLEEARDLQVHRLDLGRVADVRLPAGSVRDQLEDALLRLAAVGDREDARLADRALGALSQVLQQLVEVGMGGRVGAVGEQD